MRAFRSGTDLPPGVVKRFKMKHQASRDVFTYWDRLRGEAALPDRRDFDPVAVRKWLDWIVMLDTDMQSGAPIRVSTTGLGALFGRELRGESFVSLWNLGDRAETIDLIDSACLGAEPACATVEVSAPDRDPVEMELLVLPFRRLGASGSRALCVMSFKTLPTWIGLIPANRLAWPKRPAASNGLTKPPVRAPGHLISSAR